jgi:virginiamycin B lyase
MNRTCLIAGFACSIALPFFLATGAASRAQNKGKQSPGAGASAMLSGLGSVSGTVKAPGEFKAAKVYLKNVDKNVVYMVFTEGGRYQAVDLFPGNYEVSVKKNGFADSEVQKLTIAAGASGTADFSLKEGTYRPNQQMRSGLPHNEPLYSYDELYPPGHARETIERTCIMCHGPDFLPNKHQWNAGIDLMQNPNDNAGARLVPGTFAAGEREELVAYLVKNFGPDSKKRGLQVPDEPIDEKALGKAMFIEYHIPPLAKGDRGFHDAHLSQNGDVWYVDARGVQVGKMDPRTATWTDYALAGPQYRGHGLTQDASGDIWVAGHTAFVRVDSKTGAIKYIPYDPEAKRPPHGNTPFVDSRQNIWESLSWANEIAKYDHTTGEVSLYKTPTDNSFAYGMVMDKNDKVWLADWWRCKVTKFDPVSTQWIEYIPLSRPCTMRRVFADHDGMIWYALEWPGKIGKLDPNTNKIEEYAMPLKWSFPYDIQQDHDSNYWIADSGQGGALVKFEQKTKTFTYYPYVQRTDMPKIEVSNENSIWYTTRSADPQEQALGVLYPDKSKIQTLAGSY